MQTTGTLVFYTAAVTIIAAFFLFNAAMKNRVGLYYATLFAIMLALVWFLDGGMASLQPPPGPDASQSIGLSIGLIGAAFGFFTAARAIDPRRTMVGVRRTFLGLALFSLVLVIGVWFWPSTPTPFLTDLLLIGMFAAHLLATLTWRTLDGKRFRLPAMIAFSLLLVIGGTFLAVLVKGTAIVGGDLFRWLFALVTIPVMAAIGFAVADIRRSRDSALAAAASAARKDAELSAALLETERNYTRARDIAAQRMQRISTVSHDIRQPIGAMRAELDSLKGEIAADNSERLDRILNHFDALTNEYARSGKYGAPKDAKEGAAMVEGSENVPVSLLFSMLKRMFDAEAKSKGIDLRFVASACVFHAPAVILMRICANLVLNAIHHSQATRILVGVRRTRDDWRLEILDDGIGFPSSNVGSALVAGVKGDDSDGSGLGLSIVRELSAVHDLDLRYQSVEGRGAAFSISVPTSS